MAASKVVKLEDIHGLSHKQLQAFDGAGTASTVLAYGTDSSLIQTSRLDNESELDEQDNEESRDKLYPMPENWPKVPQIFRRRSCELTTSTSPCVNKAVSHLELLQNVIEDWFKEKEEDRKSSAASKNLKDVRFSETRDSLSKRLNSAASKHTVSTRPGTELSVHGVGFKADEPEFPDTGPFLGAEDAIDEVMTLLARLENDRQETDQALVREKERVIRLGNRIDHYCARRIKELPAVVQKEHEECIVDLNELQWHVAYSSRNEARIKERVDIAELLNRRLKEDIEFVKKHIPLVEEKLELELEAMEKIRSAQSDTNQELDNTKNRQEKTEAKSNEANVKAEKERAHIKSEVDQVRDALSAINEELSEAKMTYNAYTHQINDIEQNLKDNEQELKVLQVKNENAKVAEEMQAAKVQDLNERITEAENDRTKLEAENAKLLAELTEKKLVYSKTIHKLEMSIKGRDNWLRQVVLKNQEVGMDVQDLQDKIEDCQRQKMKDEKNVARIHKEMQKIGSQMSVTMEEFNRVAAINSTIRDQLTAEQEKCHKMEESLKITAETLRKQIKDEVHQKTVLASRITSDSQDLTKSRSDIKDKRTKFRRRRVNLDLDHDYDYDTDYPEDMLSPASKVADDVVTAVKTVKEKVEKLRSAKAEKARKKRELSSKREETVKQMQESEQRFEERKTKLSPHHKHLKDDELKVCKRLDHMEWKADIMQNKMDDMDKSQGMMDRLTTSTAKALETLTADMEELNIQLEASQKMTDDLKFQFNEVLTRYRDNESNHRKLMDERRKVLREIEEDKKRSVTLNKELASRYRTLQNHYYVTKDQYMNQFEERIKLENVVKDCRQLQALQIRMHGFMMEYYKYRGLYNSAELARCEEESGKNSDKVTSLQDSMNSALSNITDFLQTQMTGDVAREMAWEQVQKQEAKAQRPPTKLKASNTVRVA